MDSDMHTDSSCSLDETDESADEDDLNEACCFKEKVLQLPKCFCSEEDVFKEVLSPATWNAVLSSKYADRLKKLLPSFPENDEKEKNETLKKLIDGENFKFGSPLRQFFNKLKDGYLSSDIVEITSALKKANYREYQNQQHQYTYNLLQDILISRKKLIEATYRLPPGHVVKMQQFIAKPKNATLLERTRLRYFSMLQDIREVSELDISSEDENYPESNAPKVFRKYKKHQQIHSASISPGLSRVTSTTFHPPGYPGSGYFFNPCLEMFEVSEDRYREMLHTYKQKLALEPDDPKLKISHLNLKEVIARSNIGKRPQRNADNPARKKSKTAEKAGNGVNSTSTSVFIKCESSLSNTFNGEESSNNSSSQNAASPIMPPSVQEVEVQTDPLIKVENAEDSKAAFDSNDQNIRVPSPQIKQEPQEYPTCFFALLRDLFCESAEQKLSATKLEEKVRDFQGGPTAALYEWLNYHESWSDLVSSALKFLSGDLISILPDTFVPFLNYKEKQQQWQWIGSGRDSDDQMYELCQQWLENKDDVTSDILETCQGSPPPPRVTTEWTVRPTADEEKRTYREQEYIRYQNPHKAFTFRVHGYEAVVGPVKGVYAKESGINKARGHSLLISDRPPFVTILSLVRDSAARLPNGEGTRSDICELLKDSQYLLPAIDPQINTVVSGALDRLHYEKDPCVKYDCNRKLWIYLHRNRTEEEFERIHQAQAATAKARKAVQKSKLPKFKPKDIVHPLTTACDVSNSENGPLMNVNAPSNTILHSPKTQASPKQNHTESQYVTHTDTTTTNQIPSEMKCAAFNIENQIKTEATRNDPTSNINQSTDNKQTIASIIAALNKEIDNAHQPTLASVLQLANAKSTIGNATSTQKVSSRPVQVKTIKSEPDLSVNATPSQIHDVLRISNMKSSSPSFVGQPPVLQPCYTNVEISNSHSNVMSITPPTMSTTANSIAKAKANCTNVSGSPSAVAGFQTIAIKTENGLPVNSAPSEVHKVLNINNMKSSSPSFVGQPPVLQPSYTTVNVSKSHTRLTSTTPPVKSTTAKSIVKTKVNYGNLTGLPGAIAGYQTIVIKQEPGNVKCVTKIPLLPTEERLPSTNPSAGTVVARLVPGSQYLSFRNIAANPTSSVPKHIATAVQNFRVQGRNISQQVLSSSTIKVINSTPVTAMTDTRIPVIAPKNQISSGKESTVFKQSSAALNVCGRLYQMANARRAVVPKILSESKTAETVPPKEMSNKAEKDSKKLVPKGRKTNF